MSLSMEKISSGWPSPDAHAAWLIQISLHLSVREEEAEFYRDANEDFVRRLWQTGQAAAAFITAEGEYFIVCARGVALDRLKIEEMPAIAAEIASLRVKPLRWSFQ